MSALDIYIDLVSRRVEHLERLWKVQDYAVRNMSTLRPLTLWIGATLIGYGGVMAVSHIVLTLLFLVLAAATGVYALRRAVGKRRAPAMRRELYAYLRAVSLLSRLETISLSRYILTASSLLLVPAYLVGGLLWYITLAASLLSSTIYVAYLFDEERYRREVVQVLGRWGA